MGPLLSGVGYPMANGERTENLQPCLPVHQLQLNPSNALRAQVIVGSGGISPSSLNNRSVIIKLAGALHALALHAVRPLSDGRQLTRLLQTHHAATLV